MIIIIDKIILNQNWKHFHIVTFDI